MGDVKQNEKKNSAIWIFAIAVAAASNLIMAGFASNAQETVKPELQYTTCTTDELESLRTRDTTVYNGTDYSSEYSSVVYAVNYPEVAQSLDYDPAKLLQDYVMNGKTEGRRADVLLDQPYCTATGDNAYVYAYADLVYSNTDIQAILDGVNESRKQNGLQPLTLDPALSYYACVRAEELRTTFSHRRPDGTRGLYIIKNAEPNCTAMGENIARGQKDGAAVEQSWMNSQKHRANILSGSYTKIGIGVSGKCYVQLFSN